MQKFPRDNATFCCKMPKIICNIIVLKLPAGLTACCKKKPNNVIDSIDLIFIKFKFWPIVMSKYHTCITGNGLVMDVKRLREPTSRLFHALWKEMSIHNMKFGKKCWYLQYSLPLRCQIVVPNNNSMKYAKISTWDHNVLSQNAQNDLQYNRS